MLVKFWKKQGGFTIFSLMLTIGAVAVIAVSVLVVVDPVKRIGQANDAKRLVDIRAFAQAVETYAIDNHQIPADLSMSGLAEDEKFVLCSSEGALTCDGETLVCLVVDDSDFLGAYIPELPVDPSKSNANDTGYYITRKSDNMLAVGACDSYSDDTIQITAKASLPDYVAPICGDGTREGSEICDDGDTTTEACGDDTIQSGTYCNATCTTVLAMSETCDDGNTTTETQTCGNSIQEIGTYCNAGCTAVINLTEACDDGDTSWEGCGSSSVEDAGSYCNPTCTGVTVVSVDEQCDSNRWSGECEMFGTTYYTGGFTKRTGGVCDKYSVGCSYDCDECTGFCEMGP
jgi:hypothetical protein